MECILSLGKKCTFRSAKARKLDAGQVFDVLEVQGVFVLVSSRRIAADNLLPLYYTMRQIEPVNSQQLIRT